MMATRLYTPEQFSMTAGVNVPFDLALIEDLYDALPRRLGETRLTDLIDDRRFAETIYRVALADGIILRRLRQGQHADECVRHRRAAHRLRGRPQPPQAGPLHARQPLAHLAARGV